MLKIFSAGAFKGATSPLQGPRKGPRGQGLARFWTSPLNVNAETSTASLCSGLVGKSVIALKSMLTQHDS